MTLMCNWCRKQLCEDCRHPTWHAFLCGWIFHRSIYFVKPEAQP